MTAVVHANARKERAALERLLVLEASLRDVANASAQSLVDLQVGRGRAGIGAYVVHLAGMIDGSTPLPRPLT